MKITHNKALSADGYSRRHYARDGNVNSDRCEDKFSLIDKSDI